MSAIIVGIDADIKCIECPMRDIDDNCTAQEYSGDTWEEMKEDCPLKSVDGLIDFIKDHSYPVKDDRNSVEQGMTITGIEQAIKEYCGMD